MRIVQKRYSFKVTVRKGVVAAGAVATGILAAVSVIPNVDTVRQIPVAVGIGAVVGGIRAGLNYWKQHRDGS